MLLREYQQECVDITVPVLQKKQNALIVAPTGAGKTILLSAIIRDVLKEHPNWPGAKDRRKKYKLCRSS